MYFLLLIDKLTSMGFSIFCTYIIKYAVITYKYEFFPYVLKIHMYKNILYAKQKFNPFCSLYLQQHLNTGSFNVYFNYFYFPTYNAKGVYTKEAADTPLYCLFLLATKCGSLRPG